MAGAAASGLTADEQEDRSLLGRYLRRSAFPADRAALLAEAIENDAPQHVRDELDRLPDNGAEYLNVAGVWAVLSGRDVDDTDRRF